MSSRTLFVGRLSFDARTRDLEDFFYRYRPYSIEIKRGGFAFVEFYHREDAADALHDLDGRDLLGRRVSIEWARGGKKNKDSDVCFRCGREGHWARHCPGSSSSRSSSSRSGRSSRRRSRSRSGSRSRSRSRSPRRSHRSRRSHSPRSPSGSRSPSRGRSPSKSPNHERHRSKSPSPRHSPKNKLDEPPKGDQAPPAADNNDAAPAEVTTNGGVDGGDGNPNPPAEAPAEEASA